MNCLVWPTYVKLEHYGKQQSALMLNLIYICHKFEYLDWVLSCKSAGKNDFTLVKCRNAEELVRYTICINS